MEKMIHQQVEESLAGYLQPFKETYKDEGFSFQIESYVTDVGVTGFFKDEYHPDKATPFCLLQLSILPDCRQIHITNIFLPEFMHHKAIGKQMIGILFRLAKQQGYDLFLVDMVNSFYRRMINRGALPCDECDDAVQIVDTTDLR